MFCRRCGASINPDVRFCKRCGTQVATREQSEAAPRTALLHSAQPAGVERASPRTIEAIPASKPILLWVGLAILGVIVLGGAFYFYRAHQMISDDTIVKNLKAKLYDNVNLRKCTIDVTAQNGVVTLVGLVNSAVDKANAVQIAGQQRGVKQVIDNLVLQGPAPPSRLTIEVPADQAWTATGIFLNAGAVVAISASGNASMGGGWPPMPPSGRPPDCGGRGGFPAPQLPCWSLIGKIGEQGTMFYVGSKVTLQAPSSGQLFLGVNDDILGDNSGSWTATVTAQADSASSADPQQPAGRPAIVEAIIREGQTSLQLPAGGMYIYGMTTGGARPSGPFVTGRYAEIRDAAGILAAALAYGTNDTNSYTSQAVDHTIGGVSISGQWDSFKAFYGSNSRPGASNASADFLVYEDSLVVVVALASSQWHLSLQGIPELQVDASAANQGNETQMIIAHAYLRPGIYRISESSSGFGQDAPYMADLIGVFVFGSKH